VPPVTPHARTVPAGTRIAPAAVDLDPSAGTLDWNCGTQTYDGHTGEDSIIRSLREQRIGVPVFAAFDGFVIDVSDRLPDEHTEKTMTVVDNHVIVSSFGRQQRTVYGHLRGDVPVRVGQRVVAGQQIGWTASSGHSSWPHLHLTGKVGLQVYEPFAGPCRPGKSYWRSQPAMPTAPYVRDFTFSRKPFGDRRDPPWDEAVRTGTFTTGLRDVYFRIELAFFDGGPMRVTFVRPDGSVALDAERETRLQGYRATWTTRHERLDLDRAGTWHLRLAADGVTLVDGPFRVVSPGA
jgi:peptidase M23-like protein